MQESLVTWLIRVKLEFTGLTLVRTPLLVTVNRLVPMEFFATTSQTTHSIKTKQIGEVQVKIKQKSKDLQNSTSLVASTLNLSVDLSANKISNLKASTAP